MMTPTNEAELLQNLQQLFEQKRYAEALVIAQSLQREHPTKIEYHNNVAGLFVFLGRWADAESAYRTSLSLARSQPMTQFYLAEALFCQDKPIEALEVLEDVTQAFPHFTAHKSLLEKIHKQGFRLPPKNQPPALRLNLGAGHRKIKGFVSVDISPSSSPDLVLDLEKTPWPWEDDCVSDIQMIHVLEHLGQESCTFFAIIQELYRICQDGAQIYIVVPHPRSNDFLSDPTHVRPIMPGTLGLFDRQKNLEWQAQNAPNTPLALMLKVDFVMRSFTHHLKPDWQAKLDAGQMTHDQIQSAIDQYNNVVSYIEVIWQVRKK